MTTVLIVLAGAAIAGLLAWNLALHRKLKSRDADLVAAREESGTARAAFVSDVTHELGTPLTTIAGALDMIVEGESLPPEVAELVGMAIAGADGMHRIITDLATIEKIRTGRASFNTEAVDLGTLLEQVIEDARERAEARGVACVLEAGAGVTVEGDRERLLQVFHHLVANAVGASPPEGRVTVSVAGADGNVRIDVADRGPGIADALRHTLFDVFARGGAPDSNGEGVGLGLALARGIVDRHGGRIYVHSSSHAGTTMSVELPAARGAGQGHGHDDSSTE
ncbi:MAG: HAMP domain-containing sensor histidine kinase [Rhodospirillales bacterium]|nr:HAMP domain-containing sensor histidine kinase [Rhodospirillales bacterium]